MKLHAKLSWNQQSNSILEGYVDATIPASESIDAYMSHNCFAGETNSIF